jgi:hypothetical protein
MLELKTQAKKRRSPPPAGRKPGVRPAWDNL